MLENALSVGLVCFFCAVASTFVGLTVALTRDHSRVKSVFVAALVWGFAFALCFATQVLLLHTHGGLARVLTSCLLATASQVFLLGFYIVLRK